MPREARLAQTLVELADTLVNEFDIVELLNRLTDRCVELLDVSAAGIMLAAPDGVLRVIASSSAPIRVLELFELQSEEGPCLDCFRTAGEVLNQNLTTARDRWPRFAPEALEAGFRSVQALPMRLRGTTIGALNLFHADAVELTPADVAAAQSLADVATIAILQHRAVREAQVVNEQLVHVLNGRIIVEQAKGVVGERTGASMDAASAMLQEHASRHGQKLVDVAQSIIEGTLAAGALSADASTER